LGQNPAYSASDRVRYGLVPVLKFFALRTFYHSARGVTSAGFIQSFSHLFIAICKAHYVENIESEAPEEVARWSVIGKIVSF